MHFHCLHWLMLAGLVFLSAFDEHVNPQLVKWCQWSAPVWQWGPNMAPTVSAWLSLASFCNGILALCGYMYTS